MSSSKYTIEDVTERLGITARTLHYYEEIGLLAEVPRTEGGHRLYDENMLERIEHILKLKKLLGVSLQEIRDILQAEEELGRIRTSYYEQRRTEEERSLLLERASDMLRTLIAQIDDKMIKLQEMRRSFEERLDKANRLKRQP